MTGYLKVKINRLFHGFASVKSLIVEKAMKEGRGLKIYCGDDVMTVEYKNLGKHHKNNLYIKSKYNISQTYDLWDYDFKPDKREKQITFDLFTTIINQQRLETKYNGEA